MSATASPRPDDLLQVLRGPGRRIVREMPVYHDHGGGYGWSESNERWMAIVNQYGPEGAEYAAFTMLLWDSMTGTLSAVGHNNVDDDGLPLFPATYVQPVLDEHYLYWVQASRNPSGVGQTPVGSEVVQVELATGHARVLYQGVANSVLPYRGLVLYSAIQDQGPVLLPNGELNALIRAVDEETGEPAPAPEGITAGADAAREMVTNGDAIVWERNQGGLAVWRPSWSHTVVVIPDDPAGALAGVIADDALGMYHQFVVFRANGVAWVLDLRTDSIARLSQAGGRVDFGAEHFVTVTAWTNAHSEAYSLYLLDLATVPDLPGCGSS